MRITIFIFFISLTTSAQIQFSDVSNSASVGDEGSNYGVSVADFNNDGWDDIYVTRRPGANRLFQNNGDGTFTDVAASAGVAFDDKTRIAIWGDINNDGCIDLFLANDNNVNDKLYLNNCDGTFEDISTSAGIEDDNWIQAAVMGDVDNDGFLDIYITHLNYRNILWKNNGNNTFTDITIEAGVTDNLISMGAVFFDYDNDRDLDLYLTHDANGPNILFQNDGLGHFTDVADQSNTAIAKLGMGVDAGDFNNDGWMDLYITNLFPNNLLVNNGDGTFTDISYSAGDDVADGGMGWGTTFVDIDNDGFQDIYFVNTAGSPNFLLHNNGNETFKTIIPNLQMAEVGTTYGLASLDYNNDGKMDVFVAASNTVIPNRLFDNHSITDHHWIKIKTIGTVSNYNGIGTRVKVIAGDQQYIDEVMAGSGWSSQNSMDIHFGLGETEIVDTLLLQWQSGITDTITNLSADQIYTVEEGNGLTPTITAVEDLEKNIAVNISPNPFRENIVIDLSLNQASSMVVSIFNVNGQLVETIFNGQKTQGNHQLEWSSTLLSSGIYFIKIKNSKNLIIKKVLKL